MGRVSGGVRGGRAAGVAGRGARATGANPHPRARPPPIHGVPALPHWCPLCLPACLPVDYDPNLEESKLQVYQAYLTACDEEGFGGTFTDFLHDIDKQELLEVRAGFSFRQAGAEGT